MWAWSVIRVAELKQTHAVLPSGGSQKLAQRCDEPLVLGAAPDRDAHRARTSERCPSAHQDAALAETRQHRFLLRAVLREVNPDEVGIGVRHPEPEVLDVAQER